MRKMEDPNTCVWDMYPSGNQIKFTAAFTQLSANWIALFTGDRK